MRKITRTMVVLAGAFGIGCGGAPARGTLLASEPATALKADGTAGLVARWEYYQVGRLGLDVVGVDNQGYTQLSLWVRRADLERDGVADGVEIETDYPEYSRVVVDNQGTIKGAILPGGATQALLTEWVAHNQPRLEGVREAARQSPASPWPDKGAEISCGVFLGVAAALTVCSVAEAYSLGGATPICAPIFAEGGATMFGIVTAGLSLGGCVFW